ncbi:MAG: hypothetical protein AB8G86_12385 [Saprospiraceae bacterium]
MSTIQQKYFSLLLFAVIILLAACDPAIDEDIAIPALPAAPTLAIEVSADNPNIIIVKDLSTNSFSRVWDLPGGTPNKSSLAIDTILYTKAGNYTISLHAAAEGGGGTSFANQNIVIEEDAVVDCSEELVFLTGGCDNPVGKCWTFSQVAGAVSVGPIPGSTEWFTSLEGGLEAAQYDDSFCFSFEGAGFQYLNNGQTIDPFNGYAAVDFDPPTGLTYFLAAKAGDNGETRIVLPEGSFMGVMDSGPLYDIILLTENELVVRSQILNTDGWFDLYFVVR